MVDALNAWGPPIVVGLLTGCASFLGAWGAVGAKLALLQAAVDRAHQRIDNMLERRAA